MTQVKLLSPFPGKCNPFLQWAERHTSQWLARFSLLPSELEHRYNREGKFTWMVARMFPGADSERLCLASDLNALLFVMDDKFDGQDTKGVKKQLFAGMIEAINGIMKGEPSSNSHPVLLAFNDVWHRLTGISTPAWQNRFRESLREALQANLWRMEIVDQELVPSLSQYVHYRPMIGGANFFTFLLEVMEQIDLPEQVLANKTIQQLMTLAAGTICWANDIYSFRKELAEGDDLNLVMLLRRERGGSIRDGLQSAVRFHDRRVREFIQLGWNPPTFGNSLVDGEVVRFTQALGVMMNANIKWSTEDTLRYRSNIRRARPVVRTR